MNFDYLTEEEKQEFKKILSGDKIGSMILAIVWIGFVGFMAYGESSSRREGSIYGNNSLLFFMTVFMLVGVGLLVSAICKVAFRNPETYLLVRGKMLERWSRKSGKSNSLRMYYANILADGIEYKRIRIKRNMYYQRSNAVTVALKNNKIHYVIKTKMSDEELIRDYLG